MQRNRIMRVVRRDASRPAQLRASRRQSFTFLTAGSGHAPRFRRQVVFLDSRCPTGKLRLDSGGRARAAAPARQTGNSGVNPGRPRRCDRAIFSGPRSSWPVKDRPAAFDPLRSSGSWRRIARRTQSADARKSEDLPGVGSLSDREGGMTGTAAGAAGRDNAQDPLLQAPASYPGRSCACTGCLRIEVCACQAVIQWISLRGVGGAA